MRSNVPIPGSTWPRDMVIRVDPHSHLITLLFVRHAWGLARALDIPGLEPAPDVGASSVPLTASQDEWSERWARLWQQAWAWFTAADPVRPRWESTYGRDGIDSVALTDWERAVQGPLPPVSPEHDCVDVLVPAWRSGIDSIVVLPYRGYYVHRLSRRHLAVSRSTREDRVLYRRALATIT